MIDDFVLWIVQKLLILLLVLCVVAVGAILVGAIHEHNAENGAFNECIVRGIGTAGDLTAFKKMTDFTAKDLLVSEAARNTFETFKRGDLKTAKKTKTTTIVMPIVMSH